MNKLRALCFVGIGMAALLAASPALAQFGGPPQQQQGFESFGQNPADYTAEEAAAVDVIIDWIDTTNTKDLAAHMALIDDSITYRADPSEALGREGPRGYCAFFGFVQSNAWVRLDEVYAIGGPNDTLVLVKRIDINGPAGPGMGGLGGYPVQLADLVRVKDGKIVEWYDIPINRIGPGVNQPPNSRPQGMTVPDACMPYPGEVSVPPPGGLGPLPGGAPPEPHPVAAATLGNGMVSYGTTKQEGWLNVEETEAARAVRGWFAARKAADPKLLAGFVDKNAIFRASVDGEVVNGRDALLKAACAVMGGSLELKDIYLIGADFVTTVIARWDRTDPDGTVSKMGSFFRVQNGLITEWMDSAVDGTMPTADPNSAACQSINATLAAYAPLPIVGGQGAAAAPPPGGLPPGAPPAGAPPAGGLPPGAPPA